MDATRTHRDNGKNCQGWWQGWKERWQMWLIIVLDIFNINIIVVDFFFLSNFLWYDFDFVCFCGGFRGGEKGEGWL